MALRIPFATATAAALLTTVVAAGCDAPARPAVTPHQMSSSVERAPSTTALAPRDTAAIPVPPPAGVSVMFDRAPKATDLCKTKVSAADLYSSWRDFFGLQERRDLSLDELARRVEDSLQALSDFKHVNGFVDLPWSEYEELEKDALGPRKVPLSIYKAFASRYLAQLGAEALYSVPRPNGTSHLWQHILWNEAAPVKEKRTGDNQIARATILTSLQQLAVLPPAELNGVTVAFVGIKAPDEGGQAVSEENLIMIDVVKGATTSNGWYLYGQQGPEAQVAAHEVAHLTSWRVCGLMVNKKGVRDDPLFTSFIPGFAFGPRVVQTMTEPGVYRDYIGFERSTPGRVAVARAYGAKNPEEAQAVLLGELANNTRFLGKLHPPTESDPTALKAQTALWMARLHHARPASYDYYRLLSDLARVRAVVRARLTPLEVQALEILEAPTAIYNTTDPRLEPLRKQGLSRLQELENQATAAITGLPAYPTSAINESRW